MLNLSRSAVSLKKSCPVYRKRLKSCQIADADIKVRASCIYSVASPFANIRQNPQFNKSSLKMHTASHDPVYHVSED